MTLKKFYAIYIFLLLPVAVGLVLYFTIKYGLSAKEMMFLLLFLSLELPVGVNPERVASAVKVVPKVNRVKLNGN
ncbi:hypothetical protein [Thermovibrio sp.]